MFIESLQILAFIVFSEIVGRRSPTESTSGYQGQLLTLDSTVGCLDLPRVLQGPEDEISGLP